MFIDDLKEFQKQRSSSNLTESIVGSQTESIANDKPETVATKRRSTSSLSPSAIKKAKLKPKSSKN